MGKGRAGPMRGRDHDQRQHHGPRVPPSASPPPKDRMPRLQQGPTPRSYHTAPSPHEKGPVPFRTGPHISPAWRGPIRNCRPAHYDHAALPLSHAGLSRRGAGHHARRVHLAPRKEAPSPSGQGLISHQHGADRSGTVDLRITTTLPCPGPRRPLTTRGMSSRPARPTRKAPSPSGQGLISHQHGAGGQIRTVDLRITSALLYP